jgi:hypothetical protein
MEKENMQGSKNDRMCDWCGYKQGMRYSWLRLLLAILIGLFIFFAGIEIGQMRAAVYGGEYGQGMMMHHMHDDQDSDMNGTMMNNQMMPGQDGSTTTTFVVPSNPEMPTSGPTAPNNQ